MLWKIGLPKMKIGSVQDKVAIGRSLKEVMAFEAQPLVRPPDIQSPHIRWTVRQPALIGCRDKSRRDDWLRHLLDR